MPTLRHLPRVLGAEAAEKIFSRLVEPGFAFDVEVLDRARRLGYRVVEAGITRKDSGRSLINTILSPLTKLAAMLRIRAPLGFETGPPPRTCQRWRRIAVLLGLLLGGVMVSRSQVDGDQMNLLARGFRLAQDGVVVPWGNLTSAGGYEPGSATSLRVGLPLLLVEDHRAPAASILLLHLAGYLLLDLVLLRRTSERFRLVFALVYWLNPWRLFHGSFLWNPNYLIALGPVHLVLTYLQRRRAHPLATFAKVALVGFAAQLHPAALILALLSVLLWWRGYWKPHWPAAALATGLVAASLVPWWQAVEADPTLLPGHGDGFLGRGLVYVYPLVRGIGYWFRYASFSLSQKWMAAFDFTPTLGPGADAILSPLAEGFVTVAGPLSVLVAILATWRMWRRRRGGWLAAWETAGSTRRWLSGVTVWAAVSCLVAFALSPTTVMMWQGLVVLHLAVVPLALTLVALLRTPGSGFGTSGLAVLAALLLGVNLALALGSPAYRRGGRERLEIYLERDHPLLTRLHLLETCTVGVDASHGGWPRALEYSIPR